MINRLDAARSLPTPLKSAAPAPVAAPSGDRFDPTSLVNEDRVKKLFLELTQIPGPSYHEKQVAERVKQQLATLGLTAREDNAAQAIGGEQGNLLVDVPGTIADAPPLIFLAHMDTVDIAQGVKPQEKDGVISSDGSTALGGDDRSGISEIFEMLQVLKENNIPHPPMQIIFTVAEEAGLVGSAALDPKDVHGKLGFEADYFHPNQILWGDDWGGDDDRPHPRTDDEQFLDDFTQNAIRDLGMTPQRDDLPGASSDSANIRKMGIPALIIGVGEQDVHTTDEHISVADIKNGTALMLDIIQRANQLKVGADGKIVPRQAVAAAPEEWHVAA